MRPVGPGKGRRRRVWPALAGRADLDFHPLVSYEPHTGASMRSPAPILPEQWRGTDPQRMEQETDPARLRGGFPVPLTLHAQRAAATIDDPGAVEHTQAAIGFAALFSGVQRLASRTVQHSVGLEGEVLPRAPPRFPG